MAIAAVTALILAAAVSERARALKAREELLAVVSHDLKNPLSTIQLATTMLLKRGTEESEAKLRKQAEVIQKSTGRMARLITDILDVATIQSGHLSVQLAPQDLTALIHEATELILPLANEKRLTLTQDVPPGLRVMCDRERILQVFANLLGNAVKFTPEDTVIATRFEPRGAWVECFITDSGVGHPHGAASSRLRALLDGEPRKGHGAGPVDCQRHRRGTRGQGVDPEQNRSRHHRGLFAPGRGLDTEAPGGPSTPPLSPSASSVSRRSECSRD